MKFSLAISMCDPSHYVPLARAAEAAGWDSVCVPDGGPWTESTTEAYGTGKAMVGAGDALPRALRRDRGDGGGDRAHPLLHERVEAPGPFAAPHGAHGRVGLGLAPGRIGLGIGLGWNREEFDALGVDFDTRGGRADEALGIVRALLRGEWVEHRGRHFTIPRLRQSPVVSGPLPIYVGGDSPVAMRRAARLGDGWIARAPSVDDVIALVPRMRGVLAREGRDFAGFDVLAMCPDASDEASLLLLAEGGVDEIELWPWNRYGVGLDDLPGKLDAVARYADEVIAPVRSVLGG